MGWEPGSTVEMDKTRGEWGMGHSRGGIVSLGASWRWTKLEVSRDWGIPGGELYP